MHPLVILESEKEATSLLPRKMNWFEAVSYVQSLPYGRNENRKNPRLVLSEMKGTCSSKHALLKILADENQLEGVELVLAIYKMNHMNTPGIGNSLSTNGLDYIPEAHCFLKINGERKDYTSPNSNIDRIKTDILVEHEILPNQVSEYKVHYHKDYIREWLASNQLRFSFEEIWQIREACIFSLSKNNN